MKKTLLILTVLMIVFVCAGCLGETDTPQQPTIETENSAETADTTALEEAFSEAIEEALEDVDFAEESKSNSSSDATITETVIYDDNNIKVTAKELNYDDFFGTSLNLLIENNSDKNITVQTRNTSVNGFMVDPLFSCDVAAGKKANDSVTFMTTDLETANIATIQTIELALHMFETDSWDDIVTTDAITLNTDAVDYVQMIDDSGETAYENNGIKIVVKTLDSSESIFGTELYLYIENNSDKNITVQSRDCSVNGFMIDPLFSSDIVSGKKSFDSLTFLESDLEANDITEFETIELSFHIFETESWDNVDDSDVITMTF